VPISLVIDSTYFFRSIVGPSELVIAVPYILSPAISVLNRLKQISLGSILSYILSAASIIMTGLIVLTDPVVGPARALSGVNGSSPLFTTNLPLFIDHSFLTWWSFFNNSIMYAILIVVFPLLIFSYWALVGAVKIGRDQLKDLRRVSVQASVRFGKIFESLNVREERSSKNIVLSLSSASSSESPDRK
jgi:hypothetical protein